MYELNIEAAKKAEVKQQLIDTSGKYVGVFTRAVKTVSKKGTVGIDFGFKTDDGQVANYLSIWTHNAHGGELMGHQILMAIMVCLKLRTIKEAKGVIEKYNSVTQSTEKVEGEVYPDLVNKEIGLLIQMETSEYEGKTQRKTNIYLPFSANGFSASEILSKATKPEKVDSALFLLKDRNSIKKPTQTFDTTESNSINSLEDDIPF